MHACIQLVTSDKLDVGGGVHSYLSKNFLQNIFSVDLFHLMAASLWEHIAHNDTCDPSPVHVK